MKDCVSLLSIMKKIGLQTIFGLSLFSILLLASCAKEKDEPQKKLDDYELLWLAPWKMNSVTVDPGLDFGNGVIVRDFFAQLEACQKDNIKKYESLYVIHDEGVLKCDPNHPQSESFLWTFSEDTRELTELTSPPTKYNIIKLTETELVKYSIYDGEDIGAVPGIKYKFTFTYKH